jgi:4-phytase/acid phosphatase
VPDPVFDPVLAYLGTINTNRAVIEVQGIYGSGETIASAYSGELSLISYVLYPPGTQPTPGAPQGSIDPTTETITLIATTNTPAYTGNSIDVGGLNTVNSATDPFVMQYAAGFPLEDVAWGQLSLDTLSQQTRLTVLQINIEMRPPYINRVQSSNAGSHVLRSMIQAISGRNGPRKTRNDDSPGAFGTDKSKILVIISSDYYVAGLAGLLHLHWTLPGYQPDFCSPGGALVFELRQSKKSKNYIVRAFYTSQTFDQLRNLTPLTLEEPPATMQLAIPGGSNSATNLDVSFYAFYRLLSKAIDFKDVQSIWQEDPPGVIHNVPLD